MPNTISFNRLPSMVPPYAKVLLSKKPYVAPADTQVVPVRLLVKTVNLSRAHLNRYNEICGSPQGQLAPAYLHVIALPLHMQ